MKKILCLTDFSENAYHGILYANELAKKFSSTLLIMHTYAVCDDCQKKDLFHPSQIAYSDTECRNKLSKLCMDFIKENKYTNVDYSYITRQGDIQQRVNETIREKNIDLVVLSIEGAVGTENTYYGNVLSQIVQCTPCPVIAVPGSYKYRDIKNIVYAFDIAHESTLEKEAVEFARTMNAHLDILSYCNEEDEEYAETLYSKFNQMKSKTGYAQISLDIKASENIIQSLSQFIIDREADLLLLEHHKKNMYEQISGQSFTKSFVFFSKVPVLIIRSKENQADVF